MADIAIIGAGPAGLMAAWRAAESGHNVVVFESADAVGGMSGSFEIQGQRVDYGSHRLHPSTPPHLLKRISDLLGDELQTRERNGRIRLYDRWVAFPLRTTDMARHLPIRFSLQSAYDILRRPFTKKSPVTFNDEVSNRLGKTVSDQFYSPYAEKLWGIPGDEIDGEQARRRVSAKSPLAILRRLIKSSTPGGRTFLYPKHGYGQIVEAIARAVQDAGGQIYLNSPVDSIRVKESSCQLSVKDDQYEADYVLSTAPLTVLTKIISPSPSSEIMDAAATLRVRGMVLSYLILEQNQFTEYDAHYLPGLDTKIARLSEPKNYRDGNDPEGVTVLCAEIPCWVGDTVWNSSDNELSAMVVADLEKLGLPNVKHAATVARRLPSVYPVFEKRTMVERELLLEWSESLGRLIPFGRQGLLVPDNLHHTLAMGWDAAAAFDSKGEFNQHKWEKSIRSFRNHVVED